MHDAKLSCGPFRGTVAVMIGRIHNWFPRVMTSMMTLKDSAIDEGTACDVAAVKKLGSHAMNVLCVGDSDYD